jgi:branched-chain amino acid aminotransferase
VRLVVDPVRMRASPGGVGDCKTGGSYAAAIVPTEAAIEAGFDQVLWCDGSPERAVGECGQMNVVWVERIGDVTTLVTPILDGTILAGATRDSVLALARDSKRGFVDAVEERRVPLAELTSKMARGEVIEMFGTGTGAIIVPVKSVTVGDIEFVAKDSEVGSDTSARIREALLDIYHGDAPDTEGWMIDIDC